MPPPARTPIPAGTARPFYGRVESLRGIGAAAIAGYHFSGMMVHGVPLLPAVPWAGAGIAQEALRRVGLALLPGHAALMAFFVISGFVLRLSLEHGPQKAVPAAARFLLARAFRMYPVVICGVILMAVLAGGRVHANGEPVGEALTIPRLLSNLLLIDISVNGALWALQLEVVMAPIILLLYFLERRRGPYVLLVVALASTALAYWPSWALWRPLSTNLFAFVLGMGVPAFSRRLAAGLSKRTATLLAAGVVTAMFLTGPCVGFYSRTSAVIEAYAATVLVSLIAYRPDLAGFRILDAKALRLLGLSSGSYYVFHMATPTAAMAIADILIPPAWGAAAPALVAFLVLPAWLIAIGPLAYCGYRLIEAPGVWIGRRVVEACGIGANPVPSLDGRPTVRRHAA